MLMCFSLLLFEHFKDQIWALVFNNTNKFLNKRRREKKEIKLE